MKDVKPGAVVRPTANWYATTMEGEEEKIPDDARLVVVSKYPNGDDYQQLYVTVLAGYEPLDLHESEFSVHEEDQPETRSLGMTVPSDIGFGDIIMDDNGNSFAVDTLQKDPETGKLTFAGRDTGNPRERRSTGEKNLMSRTTVGRMSPWV